MNNPLLEDRELPAFTRIRPEHAEPAIDALLAESRALVERLTAEPGPRDWTSLVDPLEAMEERLNRAWSPVRHLNSVMNDETLRAAYNACLPKLSDHATEMGHNEALFRAWQSIAEGPDFDRLAPGRRKAVQDQLRDFHLSGVDLPPEKKARFKAIAQELTALTSRYEENLLDATHAWKQHVTDAAALDGLPESGLMLARQTAEREGLDGFLLTLEFPSYLAVMTHANDRALREAVYTAFVTRASELGGHPEWDNSETMEKLLALRHEEAQLLGFTDYAALSLSIKMAERPEAAIGFLRDLAARVKTAAERDLAELRAFARERLGLDDLQAWDIAWASERLRQHAFGLSQEDLRPYFPIDRVLDGLFDLAGRLFGVRFVRVDAPEAWHPDVRLYELHRSGPTNRHPAPTGRPMHSIGRAMPDIDRTVPDIDRAMPDIDRTVPDEQTPGAHGAPYALHGSDCARRTDPRRPRGALCARFYLDLYARPKKRGGAWMDECGNRLREDGRLRVPVAFLTCNATPPVGDRPALLTHDEVTTLFHEFGHGLHHMLTRVDWPMVGGINGVEWDAVELPSQFMENWCWEREPLDRIAAHWETGERLPDDLYERMIRARNFQSGMHFARQIEFALFDLRLHTEYDPAQGGRIQQILDEVRDEVAVMKPPPFNRFQHGFSHIFAGGYAAGYYSYLWAEVLSADAFARFEEEGLFNPETGHAFLREILEVGGSRPAHESFVAFRGREPRIDALLRHNGLTE